MVSHLALNSSKDSSWCSLRRRAEVLKVGRATAKGRTAAVDRMVVARRKEVAGPRAAIRKRDIFSFLVFFITRWIGSSRFRKQTGEQKKEKDLKIERWENCLVVTQGEKVRASQIGRSGLGSGEWAWAW